MTVKLSRKFHGQRNASEAGSFGACRELTIAGAILLIWGVVLGSTAEGAVFSCEDRLLVNYDQALKGMPDNRLPGRAGLPLGPNDLKLRPGPPVLVEGEPVIYALLLHRRLGEDGHVARPASLGWTIAMRLDSVDRAGRSRGISGYRHWEVGRLREPERQFDLPTRKAGLYRVSMTIEKHGRTLVRYRQFAVVLARRENLSISIQGDGPYRAGAVVAARIENHGTEEAEAPVGTGLSVERLEEGSWKAVDVSESPSVMFGDPEFIPRGRASRCSYFQIPVDSAPGEFRFSAVVQSGLGKPRKVVGLFGVS